MYLRKPHTRDIPALNRLCLRSKAYWGYDAAFMDACRTELTLTAQHLQADSLILAEMDGNPIGVAQVRHMDPDAELEKLFVDPPAIGTGAGRLLFDWAAETARAAGAVRLFIDSDPGAEGFYRKMGAESFGVSPSASIPGRYLPRLFLELVVKSP